MEFSTLFLAVESLRHSQCMRAEKASVSMHFGGNWLSFPMGEELAQDALCLDGFLTVMMPISGEPGLNFRRGQDMSH